MVHVYDRNLADIFKLFCNFLQKFSARFYNGSKSLSGDVSYDPRTKVSECYKGMRMTSYTHLHSQFVQSANVRSNAGVTMTTLNLVLNLMNND